MKAEGTGITVARYGAWAVALDHFPDGSTGPYAWAHFKGNSKQRRIARRSYIRFAKATCKARGIPLYINGILQ